MLSFPIHDLRGAELRAQRIIQRAMEASDQLALRELWCILRTAEMQEDAGGSRDGLRRIRNDVSKQLARLESVASMDDGFASMDDGAEDRSAAPIAQDGPRVLAGGSHSSGDS